MIKKQLDFLKRMWNVFNTNIIYPTSYTDSIIPAKEDTIYVYSLHKVSKPRVKEIVIPSICFRLFSFHLLNSKEPVGFCIIPTLPDNYIIRYTPLALAATFPGATKDKIINSNKLLVFSNDWLEVVKFTCGPEVITDIGHRLDIFLGEE